MVLFFETVLGREYEGKNRYNVEWIFLKVYYISAGQTSLLQVQWEFYIGTCSVWLEDRKCSAAVVGLDLVLGLSIVRRCSLKRSFKRRFVSPMYCKLQRLH